MTISRETTQIVSEKSVYNLKRKRLKATGVKNKTKNDKVFSNYKTDNIKGVEVVDNQSKRERSVEGKIQKYTQK